MELHLDPIVPMLRKNEKGCYIFNKGYVHPIRGKTYEEYYGQEKGKEKREAQSRKLKGHPYWGGSKAHSRPCVAIHEGKLLARFPTIKEAGECTGVNEATIRKYIGGKIRARNGWQWFYENESYKWCDLVR